MPENIFRMGKDGKYLSTRGHVRGGPAIRGVDFRNAEQTQSILHDAAEENGAVILRGELEEQDWKGTRYFQINILGARRTTNG